jgi:hypothetical protein
MDQSISKALVIRSLMFVALSVTLFSFTRPLGMDNYKVYLNEKLLFHQYVGKDNPTQSISLGKAVDKDQLVVYFDHCGRIGSQRVLKLMDGSSVLKEWSFPDTQTIASSGMSCSVKEIKALQKPGRTISLVYNSTEIKEGIVLSNILANNTSAKASLK